jgi:hypothetical protein
VVGRWIWMVGHRSVLQSSRSLRIIQN